jgi:hypothetical protein
MFQLRICCKKNGISFYSKDVILHVSSSLMFIVGGDSSLLFAILMTALLRGERNKPATARVA